MAGGIVELLFESLRDQPGVRIRGQSLMVGDKMFAYASGDNLIIKLPVGQVQTLLRRKDFSPHIHGHSSHVRVGRRHPRNTVRVHERPSTAQRRHTVRHESLTASPLERIETGAYPAGNAPAFALSPVL